MSADTPSGIVKSLWMDIRVTEYLALKQQRDDLAAALRELLEAADEITASSSAATVLRYSDADRTARAALAKITP